MRWPGKGDPPRHRLTAPEVRRLFDAWAKDTRGYLCDADLPESDEAYYKALRRDLDFWGCLPDPDKMKF